MHFSETHAWYERSLFDEIAQMSSEPHEDDTKEVIARRLGAADVENPLVMSRDEIMARIPKSEWEKYTVHADGMDKVLDWTIYQMLRLRPVYGLHGNLKVGTDGDRVKSVKIVFFPIAPIAGDDDDDDMED